MTNERVKTPARSGRRISWPVWLLITLVLVAVGIVYEPSEITTETYSREEAWGIDRALLRTTLGEPVAQNEYPKTIRVAHDQIEYEAAITYTLDADLQKAVDEIFAQYGPDYGVFVALDPDTGEILALANHRRNQGELNENLAIAATYPGASVFKVVTAAAAMDLGKATPKTVIPFNGKTTSLYRKNVLHHKNTQWTRRYPLTTSFAKSVNTVFARLGIFTVGGEPLKTYSSAFGFNQTWDSDFALAPSVFVIDANDPWSIAEAASGYTRNTTLSPVHGAMLAAVAVNGGQLVRPTLVKKITAEDGLSVYVHEPENEPVVSDKTASDLRTLMQETVASGSARDSFKKFFRGDMADVEVGGKTGSLTGENPPGRYDWFIGYAQKDRRKIAFAAMCINEEFWYVKSAYVARKAIQHFFSRPNTH